MKVLVSVLSLLSKQLALIVVKACHSLIPFCLMSSAAKKHVRDNLVLDINKTGLAHPIFIDVGMYLFQGR